MDKKTFPHEISDFLLGSAELARLGEIDRDAIAPFDPEHRIALLDVENLRDQEHKPRHRPPTVDAALKRDKIVQAVLYEVAAHPEKQMKEIVGKVGDYYGANSQYVYRCFAQISPERRASIEQSIMVMTLWPYAMAQMHRLMAECTSVEEKPT